MNIRKHIYLIINVILIAFILVLPYYLFEGKVFIGGDDSRLFYLYPWEWIKNISFFSWFHFSSVGTNSPNQAILPFLFLWSILEYFIFEKAVLNYLAFSLPLTLGLIYFQKLLREVLRRDAKRNMLEIWVGSLVYILSPIVIINQLAVLLYSIWLIGLLPIISYYFLKFLREGNYLYIIKAYIWCVVLSLSLSSVPWILGYVIPLTISLAIISILYKRSEIKIFIRRGILFFSFLLASQAFWFLPFVLNFFTVDKNTFVSNILSQQVSNTFVATVVSTATGNILYPLTNIFHRQIAFDYNWQLKEMFLGYYDTTIFISLFFILIFFIGLFHHTHYFKGSTRRWYLFFFLAFLIALFLFTVNIPPLKSLFLFLGNIPGFVMFRNFYDKFALGYAFLFAIIITFSLVISKKCFKRFHKVFIIGLILAIVVQAVPIKSLINKPIWGTKNIYTNVRIPDEYSRFMQEIESSLPPDGTILSLPFNIAGYTIIKDRDSNNVFAGRSPVQLFTGIHDLSGDLSLPLNARAEFIDSLKKRDYPRLRTFLQTYNITHIFVTKNIPDDVRKSYLFNQELLQYQDDAMLAQISGKKVLKSENGNYELYTTKQEGSVIRGTDLVFQKENEGKYRIYIQNLTDKEQLSFKDSFHSGWSLFLVNKPSNSWCSKERYYFYSETVVECRTDKQLFTFEDGAYLFTKPVFRESHTQLGSFGNRWIIDPGYIKNNYDTSYFKKNPDDSINIELVLYFKPQLYFYLGTLITLMSFIISLILYRKYTYIKR